MVVIMDGGRHPGLPVVPGLENLTVLARGGHATVYRATQAKAAAADDAERLWDEAPEQVGRRRRYMVLK